MNDVLRPFLHRFVLVFFDDILIYSTSEHLQHMGLVFTALRAHDLFLKCSKCSFRAPSVTYLGHVISADGVAMDSDKVAGIASWPTPRSPRVPGFGGLLPQVHPRLRLHRGASHVPPTEGGLRLDSGGGRGLCQPQAGTLDGAGAPHA